MHQLAQLNIARVKTSLDDPAMADFVNALDPVNALADQTPGFVWRLQTEAGNATSLHLYDDADLIVNMSVWASLDALLDFILSKEHVDVMKRRREWFHKCKEATLVLWWVPKGHQPSLQEAQHRLDRLRAHGPTPQAFTFRKSFPPPA